MFASIRTYRCAPGSIDALMHRVDRDFADALSREPGFVSYQVVATGADTVVATSLFGTRPDAERSNELAAAWVAEDLADFAIEPTIVATGEVMVSRAAGSVLQPAHH